MFQWKVSINWSSLLTRSNLIDHPDFALNKNITYNGSSQKHLGLTLDNKLNFKEHINTKLCNARNI